MPFPTVSDDGRTVELDLHGASLIEADRVARRCIDLCAERGRSTLRIIHGVSSSEGDAHRRTIKSILHELVEELSTGDTITGHYTYEGSLMLSFDQSTSVLPTRITINELV